MHLSATQTESSARPTALSRLADELRDSILDGTLQPGTPLREESLARRFGSSRHTVRSALSRLAAERLVTFVPFRGARVADLSDAEVEDLQDLRGALETEAIRQLNARYGNHWPDEVITPILARIKQLAEAEVNGDWFAVNRAHAAVHNSIVAAARSERVSETYSQLTSEMLLLLTGVRSHYPRGSLEAEHRNYLNEIQTGDASVVRTHLDHTTELIRNDPARAERLSLEGAG